MSGGSSGSQQQPMQGAVPTPPAAIRAVQQRARCLYSAAEVERAIDEMAVAIDARLEHANPLVLCVLSGAAIVTEKLLARLRFPLQQDSLRATRYRDATQGGELEWVQYPAQSLVGRTVLVIDDILDEGTTLNGIVEYCKQQQCQRVYTAVLVNKIHNRKQSAIKADFIGLDAEDYYLFGYGMDYKGFLRDAPGIFAVAPEDLQAAEF